MKKNIGRPTSHRTQAEQAGWSKPAGVYTGLVNLLGLVTLVYSAVQFASIFEAGWLGLAALTAITSSLALTIPIPGGRAGGLAITVSDCFVFIALLLYGPAAAALTAAVEGLVGCIRCRVKRPERFAFNVSLLTIDAYLAASLFNLLTGAAPPTTELFSGGALPALGIAAVAYFLFNSLAIALGMSLVSEQSFLRIWKTNFPWASPSLLTNTLAALFFMLAIDQPATARMALMLGSGVVCLALSSAYLLKGRRWLLDGRLAESA